MALMKWLKGGLESEVAAIFGEITISVELGSCSSTESEDVYVNEKEAYETYFNYGQNLGFSVREDHHSCWPNSINLKSKDFVCSKVDFKKLPDLNIQRKYQKSDTRDDCPAMIRFTVDEAGYWKVKKFIENHNYDFPRPEDQSLLRSCRNVCDEKAYVLKAMTEVGIRTIDAFSFLAFEVGGVENIGFTRRDAYNFIQKIKRATVDGIGRIDYDCFGDVLIFYTSYKLNKIRNKWSTAFNKDCFSMDILSTQRSESTNIVCHGISKPISSITDCFLGLEKVMRN
ncbi:hypothetical protein KFK09_003909 [Dendrobium nobile]|uniref:FAR1 domain-containing protein n=1 Tax=Dendrobium nobile TaxID=94219 RepID=A0A8T3C3W2_DENNO|nr:hypothetical protein KFK09_003909 [Dendrobium nobile]